MVIRSRKCLAIYGNQIPKVPLKHYLMISWNGPHYESSPKTDKPVPLILDNIDKAVGVFYCHFGLLGRVLDAPLLFHVTNVNFRGHCAQLIEARMLICCILQLK